MNIIVINASARQDGNTAIAVDKYLSEFKVHQARIKTYNLRSLKYSGCIDCRSCHQTGECILKDDITPLYRDYDKADILIAASPIYFLSVSAQLKAVIDRTQAVWASKYILNSPAIDREKKRLGVFIATGGASLGSNANMVARTVINMYFKAVNTQYTDELIVYNTDTLSLGNNAQKQTELKERGLLLFQKASRSFADKH